MSYPKILFLADEIPQSKQAGSIQFLRIFEDYPADKILVIGRKPLPGALTLNCTYLALTFPLADRIRLSRFHKWLANFEAMGLIKYYLPAKIRKAIEDFNPDIVVSLMQLYMYYSTAYRYAKSNQKPLYLFCHDDVEDFSAVSDFLQTTLQRRNAVIYQFASKRICISPQMEHAWKKKYGVSGEVMYPIPDKNIVPRAIEESVTLRTPGQLKIGFAGSMAYGYAEGIREIIPALQQTNSLLRIYNNPTSIVYKNISSCIEFCGYANTPNETWERAKAECDVLIIPYSREKKYITLYNTHFPSKLVDYYSLSMPVLVTGPTYATGYIYHQDKGYPVACDIKDVCEILKTLESLTAYRVKSIPTAFEQKNFNLFLKLSN